MSATHSGRGAVDAASSLAPASVAIAARADIAAGRDVGAQTRRRRPPDDEALGVRSSREERRAAARADSEPGVARASARAVAARRGSTARIPLARARKCVPARHLHARAEAGARTESTVIHLKGKIG